MMTEINYKSELSHGLEAQGDWRRELAEKHPEDETRNLDAAKLFESLAGQAQAGDIDPQIMARYIELVYGDDIDGTVCSEVASEINREIGFGFHPETIDGYLTEMISRLEARL